MGRLTITTARMIHWIAGKAIVLGQNIICTAYRWQKWGARHHEARRSDSIAL